MNIEPELKITLVFESRKLGFDFNINRYINFHNLYLVNFLNYIEEGLYCFRYVVKGEPKNLISFLKDKNIVEHMI